jgi:hypothetical protein
VDAGRPAAAGARPVVGGLAGGGGVCVIVGGWIGDDRVCAGPVFPRPFLGRYWFEYVRTLYLHTNFGEKSLNTPIVRTIYTKYMHIYT